LDPDTPLLIHGPGGEVWGNVVENCGVWGHELEYGKVLKNWDII